MSPYDESWVIASKPLPGGGRYVILKPAPIPEEGPTVQCGRAKRLIRFGSHTLAIPSPEENRAVIPLPPEGPQKPRRRRGPKHG